MADFLTNFGINPEEISFAVTALIRLVIAAVCGGLIGLERELKGRPAGLKTFSLVCIGAALVMVTNEFIMYSLSDGSGDMARMAAQVISGIGFLGAGTIMVTRDNQIRGLTTAAALWVTAALGISIGSGFYVGGIIGIFIIFLSSMCCRYIDRKITEKSPVMKVFVECNEEDSIQELVNYCGEHDIRITDMKRLKEQEWYKTSICIVAELYLGKRQYHTKVLEEIKKLEGISFTEEYQI